MGNAQLVVRLHPGSPPDDYDELLALPEASFFQSRGWLRAVTSTHPELQAWTLGAEDASGRLQGACVLVGASRWGLRRWYAGVWGTYGGILARDAPAGMAVARALQGLAARPSTWVVRLHDWARTLERYLESRAGWRRVEESCQVLELPADPAELFEGAFTARNRNKIRKAMRAGLEVRVGNDAPTLQAYASLYAESVARWGSSRRLPAAFFEALAGEAGVQVWLAWAGGEPVAGLLNLRGGGQIMNWGNVSKRSAWSLAPNNLLHWRALEAACRDLGGPRCYNFGSSAGLPGVHTFKAAFGARAYPYARWEHRARWARWGRERTRA